MLRWNSIDMTINMSIIMDMNIYITPENERKLREIQQKGGSMSGLINIAVEDFFRNAENNMFSKPKLPQHPMEAYKDASIGSSDYPQSVQGVTRGFCKHNAKIGLCKMGCK